MDNIKHRFIIAGASGFIGAAIVRRALASDYPAPIVILRSGSAPWRLSPYLSRCRVFNEDDLLNSGVQAKIKELAPATWVQVGWNGVLGRDRHSVEQISSNIPLVIRSMNSATVTGCRHWIGFGSQAEYGIHNNIIHEDSIVRPTTVYGKAKLAAYWTTLAYAQAVGLVHCWLRIFSTYGPEDDPNWLLPYIVTELSKGRVPQLTKCEQVWDYLYIDDAADAVLAAVENKLAGVFNVASGDGIVLREAVNSALSCFPDSSSVNFGGRNYAADQVMYLVGDRSRLSKATGWSPKVTLCDGVRKTVEYFKNTKA